MFGIFKKDRSPSPEKLIKAAGKGNLKSVNSQLENGTDVNSRDKKGWTPLIWASFNNYSELMKILLEKGADINARNEEGCTALMYAAGNGWIETVKMLTEAGADINIKDKKERTALIFASDSGWLETATMLVEAGAQIDNKYRDEVMALINGPVLPLPEVQPPFPEFAEKHDISVAVEVGNGKMELKISAGRCTVNWGDGSVADEYNDIKKKTISHHYTGAGSYIITVDAAGLSCFECKSATGARATSVYLNNCQQLEELSCYYNNLTSLNISRCTSLKSLSCSNNKLTSLDLSSNLKLNYLSCEYNLLACLDISNNTQLSHVDCAANKLSILNVNPNSAIQQVICNNNQLSKHELNRIFNRLPCYNSSYGTVNTWHSGQTYTPLVFIACGNNPGFDNCNKKIAENRNWLIWKKAVYMPATIAGTSGRWQEDYR